MTRSWWLLLPFFCDKQPFQKGHLCTVSLLGYQYTCISVYLPPSAILVQKMQIKIKKWTFIVEVTWRIRDRCSRFLTIYQGLITSVTCWVQNIVYVLYKSYDFDKEPTYCDHFTIEYLELSWKDIGRGEARNMSVNNW